VRVLHDRTGPTGDVVVFGFAYPMLIVFRAENAACLKHSSLFKVNWVGRGVGKEGPWSAHPPLAVGCAPRGRKR
jgi:hypothetical protein